MEVMKEAQVGAGQRRSGWRLVATEGTGNGVSGGEHEMRQAQEVARAAAGVAARARGGGMSGGGASGSSKSNSGERGCGASGGHESNSSGECAAAVVEGRVDGLFMVKPVR